MKACVIYVLPVVIGFILDAILGDPHRWPHPVRWIGSLITLLEKKLWQQNDNPKKQLVKGAVLVFIVVAVSWLLPWLLLCFAMQLSLYLYILVASVLCYWALAARGLCSESMKVCKNLCMGELEKARSELAWIVGRDTKNLSSEQVAKAAIETVAENCSDGVIAPLFFLLLGGAPLGMLYKAVNTLDSMLGYKNERYMYFGRVAARLDDFANFFPARISALFLLASGLVLCGIDAAKRGVNFFLRDRYNHTSPNSAQTEAVCAGLLGLKLGGEAYYGGKLVKKPTIGDELRKATPKDIEKINHIMYLAAVFALLTLGMLRGII